MQLVSLFSGMGGFELAGEWMGWEIVSSCEINPFGSRVLKYYWPNAYHHDNVKTLNYDEIKKRLNPNEPTILVAGFPCQPFSTAGKRKGKEDERYGWPDCVKAFTELSPNYCVFENVFGLVNWSKGLVFHEVQTDLEAAGYEVWPYVLPACAVNAPHRRDRIWFVAYRRGQQFQEWSQERNRQDSKKKRTGVDNRTKRQGNSRDAPHSNHDGRNGGNSEHETNAGEGWQYAQCDAIQGIGTWDAADTGGERQPGKKHGQKESVRFTKSHAPDNWQNFPTQSPLCTGNDGIPTQLDGITFPKWRNESIKAAGNAIVPQVAYQIFKAIEAYDKKLKQLQ